ncbi:MAG TPA: GGDEF domain-containing protein [Marinobacter sp.]|nr:GGDEF domain-containing protein [Marinobacter sp.]
MRQTAKPFLSGKLCRAGLISLLIVSALCLFMGQPLAAIAAASAGGLCLAGSPLGQHRRGRFWDSLRYLFFGVLALTLLAAVWFGPWALSHWLYALPLITFALLPPAPAAALTAALVLSALIATQWAVVLPDRHQMLGALVLTTLLATLLVFLREYKSRQLAPLRRTDELTQAASREYLSADLHKEIQRSEREGIHMSVIIIGLDTHLSAAAPDEDIRAILPRIGRYLHSQLRDFDTYYRVADLQFLAILPGVNTAEASRTAEQLRLGLHTLMQAYGLSLTVSTGVAGLNIGDDADSLQQSAANALRRAQRQGGNRTQAYSNPIHADLPAHSGPESSQR